MKDIEERDIHQGLFPTEAFVFSKPGTSTPVLAQVAGWALSAPSIRTPSVVASALTAGSVTASTGTFGSISGVDTIPVGTIILMAANLKATPPSGYLYCDGSAVSRTTYAALFDLLGTTHGQGDGSTTFNIPDYRGRFFRGQNDGSGRDPDAAGRTAMATGGNTGDNVGSVQTDAFKSHAHAYTRYNELVVAAGLAAGPAWKNTASPNTGAAGGNETRPLNANIQAFIKY